MKNLLFTLMLVFGAFGTAFAQATFDLVPDTVIAIVPIDSHDVEAHNIFHNLTNAARTITWERTVISIDPDTLQTQICDLNACYLPHVSSKTFVSNPGAMDPVIVHFLNNSGGAASAVVQLKFTDMADPDNPQYAYYIFNAVVGTHDLPAANVKLYPNPTVEYFSLENADDVARIRVYTIDGRQVALFNPANNGLYSLADQPTGLYIVALESKEGQFFQAIQVKKQ